MSKITEQFIRKMPKADLHLHLDGSLRLSSLIEMAKADQIELPSYEESGLYEQVFKPHYDDLADYLTAFSYTVAVLQREEHLERAAYELALDVYAEGVRYIEVRFAPQLHIKQISELGAVVHAVHRGLNRARRKLNRAAQKEELPFAFGIILCAMRRFNRRMSPYYDQLINRSRQTSLRHAFARASLALVKEAVRLRDEDGLPIVGFDLAGEESGYPAVHHKTAFQFAHRNFLYKTVHAGEAYGPESIFQAITECHANRIGHGTFLFSEEAIKLKSIRDPAAYIGQLSEYIANQRITIEVCPTSNLQTLPSLSGIREHPIRQMIDRGLSVTLSTDNRLVSHTTLTREVMLCVNELSLSPAQLRDLVFTGFKRSFFPGSYAEKRDYVRRAIALYDQQAEEHDIPIA